MSDRHAVYRFGDDTTTVDTPEGFTVALSPDAAQPEPQDTASFEVRGADGALAFEITASHFSSGNRAENLDKFKAIAHGKRAGASCPQVVLGDINTEIGQGEDLQALADAMGLVVLVPTLKIRRTRGLQDQLHKRMDHADDHDSMFVALDPSLVDAAALAAVPHQNVAWPGEPGRLAWKTPSDDDIAQAWADDRLLTDHGILKCPLVGGAVLGLGNAARANHDKYDITNEAKVDRLTYLKGQQVIETEVVRAVRAFVAALPTSATLDADTRASTLAAFEDYEQGLAPRYQAAYDAWDDADDLCSDQTALGQAMAALGAHAKRFVRITRALSWEDIRDAADARAALRDRLTEALIAGLGIGSDDRSLPLTGHPAFDADGFRARSHAKIDAAWERIIKRQSAGDLYKLWFAELLQGQTTGGMPIPAAVFAQPTEAYIDQRLRQLGLTGTICVMVEALR